MTPIRALILSAVCTAALILAGCNDETEVAQAQPPAQSEPTRPAQPDRLGDAAQRLRDAAGQAGDAIRDGAGALVDRGREAVKDAQPMLDRAGEAAKQVGQSVQLLAQRARQDFDVAVKNLEKRLDEAGIRPAPKVGDPAARLSQPDQLKADTRAAARANAAGIGPAYVGAWALDAQQCSRIDREPVENFAVITPTTIRRAETVCNFQTVEPADGKATVNASCIAEGEAEDRQITFSTPSADALAISTVSDPTTVQFVRCNLP